jgi:hypothetical protein
MPRLKRGKTPAHGLRISNDLWFAAMEKAHAEGRDLSEVIRDLLKRYVARH